RGSNTQDVRFLAILAWLHLLPRCGEQEFPRKEFPEQIKFVGFLRLAQIFSHFLSQHARISWKFLPRENFLRGVFPSASTNNKKRGKKDFPRLGVSPTEAV